MKVATYSRISTDEDRQPFSLEAQMDRLKSYISAHDGWTLARSYSDQVSGKTLDRPGLKQALADAQDKRYDLLLVYKVDRLARSTSGLVQVLEGLDVAGVAFRSVSEPFDTSTAAGRMMIQMLGVFAEFEREMIVERTKMGLAKKASKGEWTGGKPPYGYSYDIERKLLVTEEKEAVLIRQIFDRYANRKWGSARISKWLNERARTTRRGYSWTPKTILDVLRNPTYIGRLPFNGDVFEAAHEPIVQFALFRQTQDLLKIRGEDMPLRAANATPYILTGLLTCSRCGHGFIGTRASGKTAVYRYYTCYCRQRNGTAKCDQERIPADKLEEAILGVTIEALRDRSIFEEAAVRPSNRGRRPTRQERPSSFVSRPKSQRKASQSVVTYELSRRAGCRRPPPVLASESWSKKSLPSRPRRPSLRPSFRRLRPFLPMRN